MSMFYKYIKISPNSIFSKGTNYLSENKRERIENVFVVS